MRYDKKTKHKMQVSIKKDNPKIGDFKELVRFAFLPVRITYTERVFWEKYICVYKYQTVAVINYDPISYDGVKFFKNDKGELCYNRWCVYKRKYFNL